MGGTAWVTLATNDSYALGALVVANSLKRVNTVHDLAILVTPGVTIAMKNELLKVFNFVKEVDVFDSKDETNLRLLSRPDLGITFTKLHAWRLTQFSKCVFLDADVLVVQNCDELFDREEFSAAPDAGWPDCFNSGVFVFKPSDTTYQALIDFALVNGSFDGGDQGLLNMFFSNWASDSSRRLPFLYNMCSTSTYSYLPALKQFGSQVKIIHFIGSSKPWLQQFDSTSGRIVHGDSHLTNFLQLWWDVFVANVHPTLSTEMAGLARVLAQIPTGTPISAEQLAYEDHIHRHNWEEGHIDCTGKDSWDNIWKKISSTIEPAKPPALSEEKESEIEVTKPAKLVETPTDSIPTPSVAEASATPVVAPAETPSATPVGAPAGTPSVTPVGAPAVTPSVTPVGAPAETPSVTLVGAPAETPSVTLVGAPAETPSVTPVFVPAETPVTPVVAAETPSVTTVVAPAETPATSDITPTAPVVPIAAPSETSAVSVLSSAEVSTPDAKIATPFEALADSSAISTVALGVSTTTPAVPVSTSSVENDAVPTLPGVSDLPPTTPKSTRIESQISSETLRDSIPPVVGSIVPSPAPPVTVEDSKMSSVAQETPPSSPNIASATSSESPVPLEGTDTSPISAISAAIASAVTMAATPAVTAVSSESPSSPGTPQVTPSTPTITSPTPPQSPLSVVTSKLEKLDIDSTIPETPPAGSEPPVPPKRKGSKDSAGKSGKGKK